MNVYVEKKKNVFFRYGHNDQRRCMGSAFGRRVRNTLGFMLETDASADIRKRFNGRNIVKLLHAVFKVTPDYIYCCRWISILVSASSWLHGSMEWLVSVPTTLVPDVMKTSFPSGHTVDSIFPERKVKSSSLFLGSRRKSGQFPGSLF